MKNHTKMKNHIKPLIIGNWKMNGTNADIRQVRTLIQSLNKKRYRCTVMICPPATLISRIAELKAKRIVALGAQDCHTQLSGAHTGDISAIMIKDAGANNIIIGHSERRNDYHETNKIIRDKVKTAHNIGMKAIICIGETWQQRKTGHALKTVGAQLRYSLPEQCHAKNTIIAYEPIWAIGTGQTPQPQQIADMHAHLRKALKRRFHEEGDKIPILYGGSVKPSNAKTLLNIDNVNGALVGGASLKAKDFMNIIKTYQQD